MNLKNAMQNFIKSGSKDDEIVLINELNKAELLAPIILSSPLSKPDGGAIYEEEGSNIKFIILEDEINDWGYYPAFTDRDELLKWRSDSEQETLSLRLKDFYAMLSHENNVYKGVVINAYGENFVLSTELLGGILNKSLLS